MAADDGSPRFELSANENVCLIASYVASGRWREINLNENQAQSWWAGFAKSLQGDPAQAVQDIFLMLQTLLMAERKRDFLGIQLQPAFSAYARENAAALTKALLASDVAYLATWARLFPEGFENGFPEALLTTYEGGGDSAEDAVRIYSPDLETAVHAQYWFLFYQHGRDWRLGLQQRSVTMDAGKVCDMIEIIFPDGTRRWTFFDVTSVVTTPS